MTVRIIQGDCFDVITHERWEGPVDAVLTDPPYSSGARTEAEKPSSGAMVRGVRFGNRPIENDQQTTAGFIWSMRELARMVRPLLVDGGSFVCFIDWRQWPNLVGAMESADYRVNTMVVWDKITMGMGSGFRTQHELILHASKGKPNVYSHAVPNVIQARRDLETDHPSPKPVGLLERLLEVIAPPGGTVLDPFAGSGSTAVACKNTGRRCVAIETLEKHCETAGRRIAQGVLFAEVTRG